MAREMLVETEGVTVYTPGRGNFEAAKTGEQAVPSQAEKSRNLSHEHGKPSALFQKICWEEPEKQKTRSCRAQKLSRSSAQWRGWKRGQYRETSSIGAIMGQSHRKSVRQVV